MSKQKSFEDRMAELNAVLDNLKSEQISLADTLSNYERGIKLVQECQKDLNKFEQRITLLQAKSDNKIATSFGDSEPGVK